MLRRASRRFSQRTRTSTNITTGARFLLFLLSNPASILGHSHSLPSCAFALGSRSRLRAHININININTRTFSSSSASFAMSKSEAGMGASTSTRTSGDAPFSYRFIPQEDSAWIRESEMRQKALHKCVPPLTSEGHKGSSGRVGVLGGSKTFAGAPYYASMAALKVGADLAFCFCAEEASIPLKCYSPELMVAPVYKAAEFDALVQRGRAKSEQAELLVRDMVGKVDEMMDKLHALVIGPGLGRCPLVMEATSRIVRKALDMQIPLVLDADALHMLTLPDYQNVLSSTTTDSDQEKSSDQSIVVLTPNLMERKRLEGMEDRWDPDRVIVVEKGSDDVIRSKIDGAEPILICNEIGGLKRSGGIGDILAGTLGTLVAWNRILTERGEASKADSPLACWMATIVVKRSTHVAFHEYYRSTTAPDILGKIGVTFHGMTTPST